MKLYWGLLAFVLAGCGDGDSTGHGTGEAESGVASTSNGSTEGPEPESTGTTPTGASPMDSGSSSITTGATEESGASDDEGGLRDPWAPVVAGLEASALTDFTLIVGDVNGPVFTYTKGDSAADRPYWSASAAKWVTAALVADIIDEGALQLSTRPSEVLPWWTDDALDPRSEITLAQLLAFTSGFSGTVFEPECILDGSTQVEPCAQEIYAEGLQYEPGTTFHYGPKHMQIAAAMVEQIEQSTYTEVFRARIGDVLGLREIVAFDRPSTTNPRASAGMTVTGEDYGEFLRALLDDALFDADSIGFDLDRTPDGVTLAYSPVAELQGQEWHYALGHWIECTAPFDEACADDPVLSSPGGAGFHPWMVPSKGYWGVLAREGPLGGNPPQSHQSIVLVQSVRDDIEAALSE